MVTPGARREAVAHARAHHGLSERRACAVVGVSRRVVRYRSTRPDDTGLRQRLRELAGERRRFGYRRLGYLLAREGMRPNHKKLLRLYREEGLRVRRRGGRKRALGMRAPIALPDGPNQRWSLDFVSDSLFCGRRFRIRKRSLAALLPACTGIVLSPSKLWDFEPALWSTLLTTRRVACIAVWRS